MTADEARKLAVQAKNANESELEKAEFAKAIQDIDRAARLGKTKLEVQVQPEVDNAIRLRLIALGYKAHFLTMKTQATYIQVSFE